MKHVWKLVSKHRFLLLSTGIIVMLGLIFSRTFVMEEEIFRREIRGPAFLEVPESQEGELYLLSLGVFPTSEEVLAVEGALRVLNVPVGMVTEEEGYHLFTQVMADPVEAQDLMGVLADEGISFSLETVSDKSEDNPAWRYFYEAVHKRAFQMNEEFFDSFPDDKMAIWGYFIVFSRGGSELLPVVRQQMLLETFEWLILESGDIIGTSENEGSAP